jgi:Flp pilus assembly protein TadG
MPMNVLRALARIASGQRRGQALVEFALVFPIFAIMLFGIVDLGRYVFTANSLDNGAREAARSASVSTRPAECAGLDRGACAVAIAKSRTWGVPPNGVAVTVTCERYGADGTLVSPAPTPAQCRTDDFIVVHAKTVFTLVTPLIAQFLGNQTISGDSRVVVNQ